MQYLPVYTTPEPPRQPPSFPSPCFLPRDRPWRHTLTTHLDTLTHEVRLVQRTQSAYAILALCAGLTATASGPAFSDKYDYLVEGFDMCASDGSGPVQIARGFAEPFVPLLEHVANEGKLPTLHQAIPFIGDILAQSADLFVTADPDLHPGYLAEGCWRLYAHIREFEADEAAHLISLIGADVQAHLQRPGRPSPRS